MGGSQRCEALRGKQFHRFSPCHVLQPPPPPLATHRPPTLSSFLDTPCSSFAAAPGRSALQTERCRPPILSLSLSLYVCVGGG